MTDTAKAGSIRTADKPETAAPVAAIAAAMKSGAKSMPIAPISVGVGIGSAALMGALLYAGRKRSARDRS